MSVFCSALFAVQLSHYLFQLYFSKHIPNRLTEDYENYVRKIYQGLSKRRLSQEYVDREVKNMPGLISP